MNSPTRQIYVLIHGLTPIAMRSTMAGYALSLQKQGVPAEDIIMVGYTARGRTLKNVTGRAFTELALKLRRAGVNVLKDDYAINIIAHSMGGLVARGLYRNYGGKIKSCIMLGTPNTGIDWVHEVPGGRKLSRLLFGNGIVASAEVGEKYLKTLPNMMHTDVTVIIGTKQHTWWNPLSWVGSAFLSDGHDGFVPCRTTILEGATLVPVHIDHLAMVTNRDFVNTIAERSMEKANEYNTNGSSSGTYGSNILRDLLSPSELH